MSETFRALLVENEDTFKVGVKKVSLADLPEGDVLIKVAYSSVNYKDGLASIPNGKIVKTYPFIPGIDLSGYVVSSSNERFKPGQPVIATSYGIGVSHFGGFSEFARIPGEWVIPLPDGIDLKEAMIYGTAGFTAALSIQRLEENGMAPGLGKVLVTGATGGVGASAVAMLSVKGYEVVASTGKSSEVEYLKALGASEIIPRIEEEGDQPKPLNKQLWQAAIDPVGGQTLASILSRIAYRGSVAVSGLTGGTGVPTTVMPFILRGVNLLGIDSVFCPYDLRVKVWERMGRDLKPADMEPLISSEIALESLPQALDDILKSRTRGRVLVNMEA
ncbi:acryloyl-CoA reductase [Paenibacillus physcomitrellae]|uniref:Quinone oxidoreductase YhfP n=1 Tax=Paenibacillus physcomitrellae TaxID=1619311 RepID=A0ABQ1GN04_9BACL|nr:acryloyl-CoA reductase [Paenibacillus physcomitrellae]GGA47011.1 putative quinone oxidoreductase YhfP [Paenibacillus physcomitrellae]